MDNFPSLYLQLLVLLLVLSIPINVYAFYRLILLPYFAEIFFAVGSYLEELIISRRDKGLELLLDEVIKKAEEKGFTSRWPKVYVMKRGLGLLVIQGTPAYACASGRLKRILFDRKWLKVKGQHICRIIMAHELGHIIDYQTKRVGHPLFEKIRHLSDESFADAFAAFLYSKEDVVEFRIPWYLRQFDEAKFMQLDLSIGEPGIHVKSKDINVSIANTA